jgi:hypothetical protein
MPPGSSHPDEGSTLARNARHTLARAHGSLELRNLSESYVCRAGNHRRIPGHVRQRPAVGICGLCSCHHGLRHGRLVAASPRQWIGGTLDVAANYFHGNSMDYEMISLHGLQAVSVD